MRRLLVIGAVLFQLLLLLWMAGQREWVVRHGTPMVLRSAPVDPRDLFRGDYVRLDYEISTIPAARRAADLAGRELKAGERVYASLERGPFGQGQVVELSGEKPETGLFLRGRVVDDYRMANGTLRVKYGIEQLFVEQGKGIEIEQRRGNRAEVQIPMHLELAVGASGIGVITGYHWGELGIGVSLVDNPERAEGTAATFELRLQNASDAPLALALLPWQCSLELVPVKTAPEPLAPNRDQCSAYTPADARIVRLNPGDTHAITIDLDTPRWQVERNGEAVTLDTLPWPQRYRIVYAPPALDNPEGPPVWRGRLPSRAIHGQGMMD